MEIEACRVGDRLGTQERELKTLLGVFVKLCEWKKSLIKNF